MRPPKQSITDCLMAVLAIMAGKTGHVMGRNNLVTFLKPGYIRACLGNPAGYLMPQNKRRVPDTVPFHGIAATDRTCKNLHQHFTGTDPGSLPLLKPDIPVVVIHCHAHKT